MMRDLKNMNYLQSTYMIILVSSFSLIINFLVLASGFPASLQQHQSVCHDQEKFALLHFKQSFLVDCDSLVSHLEFARPKTNSWLESSSSPYDHHVLNGSTSRVKDCCSWDGVKCSEKTGHVIGLHLSSSCLYGTLPHNSSLFGLNHLRVLDLSDNHFNYSQIPSAIGSLSKLRTLNLSRSNFMGQIPLIISKMPSLSILDLSSNYALELQFDLNLKTLVGNLTRLTRLYLDEVDISSVVPVSLSNMSSLQALSLASCNLHGTFPTDILLLQKLELLYLHSNPNLEGYLPEFPSNRPLRYLILYFTAFSGELPPSIGNLGSLTKLNLLGCGFSGHIPSSIGNLTKLTHLLLPCNFNGDLPLPITNLTQLTSLFLSNVLVRPQILNSWLLRLSKLEQLQLSNMSLTGEIPSAIANLSSLELLNLGANQLTGPLPLWLANKTKLSFLDLRKNQFHGPMIPEWFSQLISLNTLAMSSIDSSVSKFDPLLKIPYLSNVELTGVNLIFPSDTSTNVSFPLFSILTLVACSLTTFPQFLRYQNKLQLFQLAENNIVGTIPQWLVNTTSESLLYIDLDDNLLTGFEQPQAFLPWNNLMGLSIQYNRLQGRLPIPPSSLQIYRVSKNKLSGVIPKEICKGNSLVFLDLSDNYLSGQIPPCIGAHLCTSLRVLNLSGNHFQGTISQTFSGACKLQMIDLSENHLEGQLPKSLTNCEELQLVDVGKNCLNDTFPSWLGSLPKLQILVMRHNNFHGGVTILESGHQFSSLRIIDLSHNFYTGSLPPTFFQNMLAMKVTDERKLEYSSTSSILITFSVPYLQTSTAYSFVYSITITYKGSDIPQKIKTMLRVVDFSSNKFTGGIPYVLGSLSGLQALNVSNNRLVGDIPSSLANIKDLQALDLSQNLLSGKIPQQLTEVTFLEIFNVSYNHLTGPIPQGEQFNTFDKSCFDGNLALCGAQLSKKCENTDSSPPPPSMSTIDQTEEDSMLIDWIVRSLGCVSGLIVGYVIGKLCITDRYDDWFMETFGKGRKPKRRAARRSVPNRRRSC